MKLHFRVPLSIRGIAAIFVAACALQTIAAAQSVSVQFINGKNDKPVGEGKPIHVVFQSGSIRTILNLHTDPEGVVQFDVQGAKTFRVAPLGYIPCGEQAVDAPLKDYSVEDVEDDGLVTRNTCGISNRQSQPGRMLYFVKRESPTESFKNLN
jgi:hypothetical protein